MHGHETEPTAFALGDLEKVMFGIPDHDGDVGIARHTRQMGCA